MGKKRLTTDEFISRSITIHGDKYDYSKVVYSNRSGKVIISCKIHGDFLQTATDHLSGCGCKKCYYDVNQYQKQFIEKASKVHNNKFDYSKVKYTGCRSKVIIICPKHGEFIQRCDQHLEGCGCPKCAFNVVDARNKFIDKAKILHNDKYDYSLVEYVNNHTNIKIICPRHGVFEQQPSVHNNSSGEKCPECTGFKQSNTKEFIKKAIRLHGNKYDYSKVNYVNNIEKITIICETHGEFEQKPIYHMDNHGCPKCGLDKRVNERKLTKEEFVKRANKIHDGKYDYSKYFCDTIFKKSIIICKEHGGFLQNPNDHLLSKAGCPECAGNKKLTNETFISLAREKHGNRYDYSLVDYKGNKKKVKIICGKHGVFLQRPNDHLAQSNGCPYCPVNVSNGEKEVTEYIRSFYDGEIITQEMSLIHPLHLDIFLPEINLAIEYNGNYFHSMNINPEKNYKSHLNKFLICKEKNIDLIQIFEDEWKLSVDKIKQYLYDRINNLDEIKGNIMNNRFPNHRLYKEKGLKEYYISKPLIYPHKSFIIYDAGRTVWKSLN